MCNPSRASEVRRGSNANMFTAARLQQRSIEMKPSKFRTWDHAKAYLHIMPRISRCLEPRTQPAYRFRIQHKVQNIYSIHNTIYDSIKLPSTSPTPVFHIAKHPTTSESCRKTISTSTSTHSRCRYGPPTRLLEMLLLPKRASNSQCY